MSQKIVVLIDQELKDLIPTYLENRANELRVLKTLASSQDAAAIAAITHKLKGNAGVYGFNWLGEVATTIETLLKSNQWSEVNQKLIEMEHYLGHLEIQFIEVTE